MRELRRPSDLAIYIAVSVGLVLNTALLPLIPDVGVWKLNLGAELNPAVWWSAIGLLMASLLSWQRSSSDTGDRLAWLGLAGVWFAFFADELACSVPLSQPYRRYSCSCLSFSPGRRRED